MLDLLAVLGNHDRSKDRLTVNQGLRYAWKPNGTPEPEKVLVIAVRTGLILRNEA